MPPKVKFNPRLAQKSPFATDPSYAQESAQENQDQAAAENEKLQKQDKIASLFNSPVLGYELGKTVAENSIPEAAASSGLSTAFSNVGAPSILDAVPEFGASVGSSGGYTLGNGGLSFGGEAIPAYAPAAETAVIGQGITGGVGLGGIAAGGYTGYQQFQGAKNVVKGKDLTPTQQIALALPTFGGSLVYNYTPLGGGKSKDQTNRDKTRMNLQNVKLIDDKYNVKLADGSAYNVGVDGKPNAMYGQYKGKDLRPYELNLDDPIVQQTIPLINPLVAVLTGGDPKQQSDFTGYLVRAAMSNANGDPKKILANIQSFYGQIAASPTALKAELDKLKSAGKITDEQYNVYVNGSQSATAGMKFGDEAASGSFSLPSFKMQSISIPAQKVLPTPPPGVPDVSSGLTPAMQSYQDAYGKGGLQQAFNNLSGTFRR